MGRLVFVMAVAGPLARATQGIGSTGCGTVKAFAGFVTRVAPTPEGGTEHRRREVVSTGMTDKGHGILAMTKATRDSAPLECRVAKGYS